MALSIVSNLRMQAASATVGPWRPPAVTYGYLDSPFDEKAQHLWRALQRFGAPLFRLTIEDGKTPKPGFWIDVARRRIDANVDRWCRVRRGLGAAPDHRD